MLVIQAEDVAELVQNRLVGIGRRSVIADASEIDRRVVLDIEGVRAEVRPVSGRGE
jgi:hypothetical protein